MTEKGIEKSKQSLCHVCNIVLPTHNAPHQHHIANRTPRKWRQIPAQAFCTEKLQNAPPNLPPLSWLELTHAPLQPQGLDRKTSVIGQFRGRQPQHLTGVLARLRHYHTLTIFIYFRGGCSC